MNCQKNNTTPTFYGIRKLLRHRTPHNLVVFLGYLQYIKYKGTLGWCQRFGGRQCPPAYLHLFSVFWNRPFVLWRARLGRNGWVANYYHVLRSNTVVLFVYEKYYVMFFISSQGWNPCEECLSVWKERKMFDMLLPCFVASIVLCTSSALLSRSIFLLK